MTTHHVRLEARETRIEISPGRFLEAWGFEGTVPGPLIVVRAGDTLVAELVNHLPEATTIHWHGIRLPAAMDGTEHAQTVVQPGESFEYRFTLPDAGTFWYHSHTNETTQIERGLYGAIVVLGHDDPVVDADRVLVLDDMKVDGNGRIAGTALFDRHGGREGDVLLVNGKVDRQLDIAMGHVERWRLVNASNARYIRLSLGGRPFRVIGHGGLRSEAETVTEALLVPGDRVELLVGPFTDMGAQIPIESLPYRRGGIMTRTRRATWATLRVGYPKESRAEIPETLAIIEPLVAGPFTPNRTIRFGARMTFHGHDWLVNGETHHRDAPVKAGELQVWEIVNETGLDHPFHLHGFFFQIVAIDGERVRPTAWHDTVNVVAKKRVTIAFRADARPGEWMYHCHILEHHAAGMMGHFEVV